MRAVIVSHGAIHDLGYAKKIMMDCQIVVCADGGAEYAVKCGIIPDAVIGDLDSIDSDVLEKLQDSGCSIIKYPKDKDYTDTQLAIDYAVNHGAHEIVMLGSLGNRMDHSLANVFLLVKLIKSGIVPCIIDEHNSIYITDSTIRLNGREGDIVSLLPVGGDVTGVYTHGLKYRLNGSVLPMGDPLGISNVFLKDEAVVTISSGLLLVIKSRD